jgi:hypothetical protein
VTYRLVARVAIAASLFAVAASVAWHGWNPLRNGYFRDYKDSPDGVYLTMAAVGFSVAALLAAVGLLVIWPRCRRYGSLAVAVLAGTASVLPAFMFKWSSRRETWPWVYITDNGELAWLRFDRPPIGWLRFDQPFDDWLTPPHWFGVTMQVALALVAVTALVTYGYLSGLRLSPSRSQARGATCSQG